MLSTWDILSQRPMVSTCNTLKSKHSHQTELYLNLKVKTLTKAKALRPTVLSCNTLQSKDFKSKKEFRFKSFYHFSLIRIF